MAYYEIVEENMNPCGGEEYRSVNITEDYVSDPVEYVRARTDPGDIVREDKEDGSIQVTWSKKGYIRRFTFS